MHVVFVGVFHLNNATGGNKDISETSQRHFRDNIMKPFTHHRYSKEYDKWQKRYSEYKMTVGAGDAETDSDLNEMLYLREAARIYLRMEAYYQAVVRSP